MVADLWRIRPTLPPEAADRLPIDWQEYGANRGCVRYAVESDTLFAARQAGMGESAEQRRSALHWWRVPDAQAVALLSAWIPAVERAIRETRKPAASARLKTMVAEYRAALAALSDVLPMMPANPQATCVDDVEPLAVLGDVGSDPERGFERTDMCRSSSPFGEW